MNMSEWNQVTLPNYQPAQQSKKKIYLIVLIILGVLLFLAVYFKYLPKITGNIVKLQECPYECCGFGLNLYQIKNCSADYECKANKCVEKDSDRDGLSDIKEKQIGTNPLKSDTDDDGLNDFQEVNIYHTNPFKSNSDCDRYSDGEEVRRGSDPNRPNSAVVECYQYEEKGSYNTPNIIKDSLIIIGSGGALEICSAGSFGACAASAPTVAAVLSGILDDVIYTTSTDVSCTNKGDDYTSFVSYNVVYYAGSEKVKNEYIIEGRMNVDEWMRKTYKYEIRLRDIPKTIWNFFSGKGKITVKIENLNYEKYPVPC